MGYPTNKDATINAVKVQLQQMLVAAETEADVVWVTPDPRRFAYAIRAALKNAQIANDPTYGKLKDLYMIKEVSINKEVIAKFKMKIVAVIKESVTEASRRMVVTSATTATQVIGAAITHEGLDELEFPNAELDETDLNTLQKWCAFKDIECLKLDKGLLLKRKEDE